MISWKHVRRCNDFGRAILARQGLSNQRWRYERDTNFSQ